MPEGGSIHKKETGEEKEKPPGEEGFVTAVLGQSVGHRGAAGMERRVEARRRRRWVYFRIRVRAALLPEPAESLTTYAPGLRLPFLSRARLWAPAPDLPCTSVLTMRPSVL